MVSSSGRSIPISPASSGSARRALEEASEDKNPELLPFIRASYGLAGIVYEVTFRIKPLEIVTFNYKVTTWRTSPRRWSTRRSPRIRRSCCGPSKDKIVIQTRNPARS